MKGSTFSWPRAKPLAGMLLIQDSPMDVPVRTVCLLRLAEHCYTHVSCVSASDQILGHNNWSPIETNRQEADS